jgi:glycosyltransferase involved in cell wall biosynthesis
LSQYTPRVSIGLPVFNSELYLREALDSVLAQTNKDAELIT